MKQILGIKKHYKNALSGHQPYYMVKVEKIAKNGVTTLFATHVTSKRTYDKLKDKLQPNSDVELKITAIQIIPENLALLKKEFAFQDNEELLRVYGR